MLLASAALMGFYHDRFWAPVDEGNYAHVAERVLSGEILNRDVQDVHAGYIDLVNTAAFSVFGIRLASLRYPIALLAVLQAGLLFLLLRPRGLAPASIGALAATSLGLVQFLNPTANWYCLFLAVATTGWLRWTPAGRRGQDIGTGLLVGTTFLFRQLSGVLLGMGVLVYLLMKGPYLPDGKRHGLARALLVVIGAGLALYLAHGTDGLGWILLGSWPFPILLYAWRRTTAPNGQVLASLGALSLGAIIAVLPLVVYHLAHGSIGTWLGDFVGAAVSLPRLDFMERPGYTLMAVLAVRGLIWGDLAARLNGAFWLGILLLTAALGLTLLRTLVRRPTESSLDPLPIIAVFYSLVAVHYQIPIYLFYVVGLCLPALLWLTTERGNRARAPALWSAAILAVIALYYQAAMPLSRGLEGIIAGQRRLPVTPLGLARGGLYVDAEDAARYHRLVDLIEQETRPGDTILALPSNAELYFLSQRSNPFRFYNAALGIRSAAELDSALQTVKCHPPKLVFYNPQDKYNTTASARLAEFVRSRYEAIPPLPPFQVFRRRDPESAGDQLGCHDPGR